MNSARRVPALCRAPSLVPRWGKCGTERRRPSGGGGWALLGWGGRVRCGDAHPRIVPGLVPKALGPGASGKNASLFSSEEPWGQGAIAGVLNHSFPGETLNVTQFSLSASLAASHKILLCCVLSFSSKYFMISFVGFFFFFFSWTHVLCRSVLLNLQILGNFPDFFLFNFIGGRLSKTYPTRFPFFDMY